MQGGTRLAVPHHSTNRHKILSVISRRSCVEPYLVTASIWHTSLSTIFPQPFVKSKRKHLVGKQLESTCVELILLREINTLINRRNHIGKPNLVLEFGTELEPTGIEITAKTEVHKIVPVLLQEYTLFLPTKVVMETTPKKAISEIAKEVNKAGKETNGEKQ